MNVLTDSSPFEKFDAMMTWPTSAELDAIIDQLDLPTKLNADAEVNRLMAESARRAFLVGYKCGRNPDLLLFEQA